MPRWTLRERRDYVRPRLSVREMEWIDFQLARLLGPEADGKWIDAGRVGLTGYLRPIVDFRDAVYAQMDNPPEADVVELDVLTPHKVVAVKDAALERAYEATKGLLTATCLYQESMQCIDRLINDDLDPNIIAWYAVSILEAYAFTPMPIHEATVLTGLRVLRRLRVQTPSGGWIVRATPMLSALHHKAAPINLAISEVAVATLHVLLEPIDNGYHKQDQDEHVDEDCEGCVLQECRQMLRALEKREGKLDVWVDSVQEIELPQAAAIVSLPSRRIVKALRDSRGPRAYPDYTANVAYSMPFLPTCLQMGTSADGQLVWWRTPQHGLWHSRSQDILHTGGKLCLPPWPLHTVDVGDGGRRLGKVLWLPYTHDFAASMDDDGSSTVLLWGSFDPTAHDGAVTIRQTFKQSHAYTLLDAGHVDYYGLDLAVHVGLLVHGAKAEEEKACYTLRVDFEPANEAVAPGHWTVPLGCSVGLASLSAQSRAPRGHRRHSTAPLWTYEGTMVVARSVLTGLPRARAYLPHMHILQAGDDGVVFAGCKHWLFRIHLLSEGDGDGEVESLSVQRCLELNGDNDDDNGGDNGKEEDMVTAMTRPRTSTGKVRLFVGTKLGRLLQVDHSDDDSFTVTELGRFDGVVSAIAPLSFPREALLVTTPACLHILSPSQ